MDKKVSTNITSLRGIGAISIVLYHYLNHISSYLYEIRFDYAKLTFAVPLFFLLSSMFLYKKAIDYQHPIKLIVHRISRLYPTYWCGVIISFISMTVVAGEKITPLRFIANFLMVEDIFGIKHIDGVYWTLLYELMLLFVFAVASTISIKKQKVICKANTFCTVWLLLGLSLQMTMKLLGKKLGGEDVVLLGGRFIPIFVFGIMLSRKFVLRLEDNRKHQLINISISIIYLLVCESLDYILMELISLGIVFCVMKGWLRENRLLQNSLLVSLGNISYCIYLIHNELGRAVILHLSGIGFRIQFLVVLSLILMVVLLAKYIGLFSAPIERKMESLLLTRLFIGSPKKS